MSRVSLKLIVVAAACWMLILSGCSRTAGVYEREGIKGDSLTLRGDGRFSLRESGETYSGTYAISGNQIVLVTAAGEARTGQVNSGRLVDPHGNRWLKK